MSSISTRPPPPCRPPLPSAVKASQNWGGGEPTPQICPGGNTYGHIRYDFFESLNPGHRSIKLDCGPDNAPVTHTEIRTGEFKSFAEGDYGDVGVSGGEWAVLRWTTTRSNHMLCGQTESSGIFQGGGIAVVLLTRRHHMH